MESIDEGFCSIGNYCDKVAHAQKKIRFRFCVATAKRGSSERTSRFVHYKILGTDNRSELLDPEVFRDSEIFDTQKRVVIKSEEFAQEYISKMSPEEREVLLHKILLAYLMQK